MIEFEKHIKYYSNFWWSSFTKMIKQTEWGNKIIAENYLEKYWLPLTEYENMWKPVQDKIFINQDKGLPELGFTEGFSLFAMQGGCLFIEEDFVRLQKCLNTIGEKHFVVIQNNLGRQLDAPSFRMKFPTNITWQELTNGNFISAVLFEMHRNEYFVFGESATWGKYSANDYEYPIDIIGFKPQNLSIFSQQFKQEEEEQLQLRKLLPLKYKW